MNKESRGSFSGFRRVALIIFLISGFCFIEGSRVYAADKSVAEEILDILKAGNQISDAQYDVLMLKAKAEKQALQLEKEALGKEREVLRNERAALKGEGAGFAGKNAFKVKDNDLRVYWKEGMRLETRDKKFKLKFGGRIQADFAAVDADDDIKDAFNDGFEGHGAEFRRARLYVSGSIFDDVVFKTEYDFTEGDVDFNDMWLGLRNLPFIGRARIGHQKEPFSLEALTSSKYNPFMERGLPNAFSPGRNTGIGFDNAVLDKRMTWGFGVFQNADSFGDAFSDRSDYNVTARIAGLPFYEEKGKKLVHLGGGYSHQFRNDSNDDNAIRYRSKPEANQTGRLVDTGKILADGADLFNFEAALVWGSLSLQGEYFFSTLDADQSGDPDFSGYYALISYFLTGEHRPYNAKAGYFGRLKPLKNYSPSKGGPGAWELAARYSSIDLNDAGIRGGEEDNITLGVNWYLNPNTRITLNYVHAEVEDRDSGGISIDDGSSDIIQSRFQVDF